MSIATSSANKIEEKGSFWGATFLVSGTCIGGGMLVMPVQTASTGFWISTFSLIVCWFFMTLSGLFLVEATLWLKNGSHFTSMSRILIGQWAKIIAIIVYLFMNYASLVAYTAGGAVLIEKATQAIFGFTFNYSINCALFTLFFGLLVWGGSRLVGKFNALLMSTLVVAYFGLVGFAAGNIEAGNLAFRPAWKEGAGIFSLILATFSYQMIVPSICSYLNYDNKQLNRAIIWGTSIPCLVYILWILVIHGAIPLSGPNSLMEALDQGRAATGPLGALFHHWALALLSDGLAFCALVTSYLGLSFALFSFLKDGFRDLKIELKRSTILLLTFIPTFFLGIANPKALLDFLDLSGGFGDTILSGILPVLMVWIGRYRLSYSGEYRVLGGKPVLFVTGLFFLLIFLFQFVKWG